MHGSSSCRLQSYTCKLAMHGAAAGHTREGATSRAASRNAWWGHFKRQAQAATAPTGLQEHVLQVLHVLLHLRSAQALQQLAAGLGAAQGVEANAAQALQGQRCGQPHAAVEAWLCGNRGAGAHGSAAAQMVGVLEHQHSSMQADTWFVCIQQLATCKAKAGPQPMAERMCGNASTPLSGPTHAPTNHPTRIRTCACLCGVRRKSLRAALCAGVQVGVAAAQVVDQALQEGAREDCRHVCCGQVGQQQLEEREGEVLALVGGACQRGGVMLGASKEDRDVRGSQGLQGAEGMEQKAGSRESGGVEEQGVREQC